MDQIYLDHGAATPLNKDVYTAMKPYFEVAYGNPLSIHATGQETQKALDQARSSVAEQLATNPDEIIFTSGATESCNLAILGVARAMADQGKHLVTTTIEHHSGLEPFGQLEKEGFEVTYIEPEENGQVLTKKVLAAIRPDTSLVSVILANSETGAIQPVDEIGNAIQKLRQENQNQCPLFHTDASAAINWLDPNVKKLHVDLMSFGAGKMYGPMGTGALFVRRGLRLQPLMFGGGREGIVRPGTPYVAGVVGLAKALEISAEQRESDSARVKELRHQFAQEIQQKIPTALINGDLDQALPGHLNVSFSGFDGEAIVLYLDAQGICASTGSACSSADFEPSQTLTSMGRTSEQALGAVRFTLGRQTTADQLKKVVEVLQETIEKLQAV